MTAVEPRGAPSLPARPTGRNLNPEELARFAAEIAARPELWEPLVYHDPDERQYASLYVDEHVGVWIISWMQGHDTGFHDHDFSCGGVAVAAGTICEQRPFWGLEPRRINPCVGDAFCFDETEIHRMVALTGDPAVTVHAYSPPLERMGVYRLDDDGYMRRHPVAWDERLAGDVREWRSYS